jgi:LDH2 family malate/lactate/ureidoglycolate dehydrogenase
MTVVSVQSLRIFASAVLSAEGLPLDDADLVADRMVASDLLGADGHGIFRLPRYVARLRAGGFNPNPAIRLISQTGATALIDGDNGFGHLVMDRAVTLAGSLARTHGVAWVGARMSNHAGAAGVHALRLAEEGLIGIYIAVGNANHMAPWGGLELLLSTNPIAIAIPGGEDPILLDMATTVAAYGKVKLAADRGELMPEGWMIDRDGNSLTDPAKAEGGSLLPIGGPKGFGLALMFGFLAGTLNGAAFGRDVIDFNADDESATNTGQVVIALDPSVFGDPAVFRAQVEAVRRDMTGSTPRAGFDGIRLPGERALAMRRLRSVEGIEMPAPLMGRLAALGAPHGIPPPAS